jgi:protein-tyrosine phosphatase
VTTVGRHLEFDRLHNFRDLGGYSTADGREVRWGQLYRSDSLGKLEADDTERFSALGIRTVIDLRYPSEIAASGRVAAEDALSYHNLSIEHRPYDQAALGPEVDPAHYLADRFAEVAEDGVDELSQVLSLIAAADVAPIVFHCASGKDRTGIVSALVLSLLGVRHADIVADFALTGLATDRLVCDWRRSHPGRTLNWPGYGQAPAELMELFLAGLARRYGSVHGYATTELAVTETMIATMRANFLTS